MNQQLSTPFYTKTDKNMPWPKDKMFYLMTRDGLFICRNHEWFSSCAPAKKGPSELEDQKPFIDLKYPMVPRALIERALGFFHLVFKDRKAESALILVWNRQTGKMELVCPKQKVSWGSVKYDIPDLPPHLALIGDIHSHCDFAPKASYTDEGDEINRPGLHIVAGYIDKEPPEFYCAVMADGQRFEVDDIKDVVEDYQKRDTDSVPKEWLGMVEEQKWQSESSVNYGGYSSGNYSAPKVIKPNAEDRAIINRVIANYVRLGKCPALYELRQALFADTRSCNYEYCEQKAKKVIKHWEQIKKEHARNGIGKCNCPHIFGYHTAKCPARAEDELNSAYD